jgi:hypothetical protein
MGDYQKESQLLLLAEFFRKNPGVTLSIAYMLLTLCGIYYSLSFYEQFNIAILKLANMSDLMIIGISDPAAILLFCGGLLIAYVADFFSRLSYETKIRWQKKPRSVKRFLVLIVVYAPRTRATAMFFFLLIFVLYSYIFVFLYAEWKSEQVKLGKGQHIAISIEDDKQERKTILLGTTTNFVVTYDQKKKQSTVYPIEKVKMIQPIIDDEVSN